MLHTSAWVTAVIVMGALVFVVLDGSYEVWAATDAARADAVANHYVCEEFGEAVGNYLLPASWARKASAGKSRPGLLVSANWLFR